MAGAEVAEKAKVPGVGTSCTNPLVTQGKQYYFRACFIDPYQARLRPPTPLKISATKRPPCSWI